MSEMALLDGKTNSKVNVRQAERKNGEWAAD